MSAFGKRDLLRAGAGLVLLLGLASLVVPPVGVGYVACLTLGGALLAALTGRARPTEYLAWLDDTLHRGEKIVVAASLIVMTLAVFVDVVWRTAHSVDASTAYGLITAIFALCIAGGLSAHWEGAGIAKRLAAGLAGFAVLAGGGALVYSAPNGFGWSQRMALVLMLWVGMLGTSMASKKHRHITIDAVKRLLPSHLVRPFQIARDVITTTLLLVLTILATRYAKANWDDWIESEMGAGIFSALPIPYWTATAPIAIAFGLMTVRTIADAFVPPEEVELLESLGASADDQPEGEE